MELVDCGAAALSIILSYYGCSLPLDVISTECLVSREGVSIAQLVKAAHSFGLDASVYEEIPFEHLKLPAILFWNRKHYVVLEGIKNNKVYINDPKQGKAIIDWQTFKQNFSHRVIQLQPNAQFKKNKITLWRNELMPLLLEHRWPLTMLCLGLMGLSLLNLSPLIFTKLVFDAYNQTHTPLLWGMFVVFLMQLVLTYKSRQLFRRLENRFATMLSTKLITRLMQLPLRFFAFRRPVDIVYRVQAVERLAAEPWFAFCSLLMAGFQGSLAVLLLCTYSPMLGGLASLVCLSSWFVLNKLNKQAEHKDSALKIGVRDLSVLTASYVTTINQIKAQCAEQRYMERWKGLLTQFFTHHHAYSKQQHLSQLTLSFLFSLGYSLLLASGIYWISANKMTFTGLMACQILFLSLQDALLQKSKLLTQRNQINLDLQCIADVTQNSIESTPATPEIKENNSISVQLIDVTFGYSHEFKPLLNQVNLTVTAGSHIAIVGASGSGKSTLIHLLSGLYEPWSGSILINGTPLLNYSLADRARLLGVVSQQHFFYQGSIRDNLCLWQPYSDEQLMSALQQACIDDLARTSVGLDYQLNEGATNISGGQRQRLELARTLLAQPQVLILDEATSSLDPIVESQIKNNVAQYVRTKIVIAHRLNTIQDADKIYLLHKGSLVDVTERQFTSQNTFSDLFATPG